jgi:SAM-dependent methyltransferase
VFANSKKLAQQTAQRVVAGHFTLTAWWALKHAGVFDAMLKLEAEKKDGEGDALVPLVHAARTSMAPEVLKALLEYLASAGLVNFNGDQARLTPEGKALLEHEDPVLELVHAYEPILDSAEHLLARLKTVGGGAVNSPVHRKSDAFTDSQARRYAPEVFPAVLSVLVKQGCTHLLDLACGAGDLLMHLAKNTRNIVGVGIGTDGGAVRRANRTIAGKGLEKRLIAVAASPLEVCADTRRTFDRIGISKQLWDEIDCLIAPTLFSELAAKDAQGSAAVIQTLSAIPRNFPNAHLLLIEPVASPRFDKNYYAPELSLLLRLSNSAPWPPEKWRDMLRQARLRLLHESPLTTDGLTLFLCKP